MYALVRRDAEYLTIELIPKSPESSIHILVFEDGADGWASANADSKAISAQPNSQQSHQFREEGRRFRRDNHSRGKQSLHYLGLITVFVGGSAFLTAYCTHFQKAEISTSTDKGDDERKPIRRRGRHFNQQGSSTSSPSFSPSIKVTHSTRRGFHSNLILFLLNRVNYHETGSVEVTLTNWHLGSTQKTSKVCSWLFKESAQLWYISRLRLRDWKKEMRQNRLRRKAKEEMDICLTKQWLQQSPSLPNPTR